LHFLIFVLKILQRSLIRLFVTIRNKKNIRSKQEILFSSNYLFLRKTLFSFKKRKSTWTSNHQFHTKKQKKETSIKKITHQWLKLFF